MGRKVPGNITEIWENGVISLFCHIPYSLGQTDRDTHTHTQPGHIHIHTVGSHRQLEEIMSSVFR